VEELAQRYDARVIFLHVVENSLNMAGPQEAYVKQWEEGLLGQMKAVKSHLAVLQAAFGKKGIDVHTHIVHGRVVDTIVNVAEREDADLIAVASHGRSGLSQVFYGSVAAGVLRRIDRPLLIIRSRDGD
jgi:nucleotide-binding universal stress UspA family protein